MVAKKDMGTKRTCQSCNARFYDLQKSPPVCPKCGTTQNLEKPARGGRSGGQKAAQQQQPAQQKAAQPAAAAGEGESIAEEAPLTEESENQQAFIEDPGDLGEEADEVAGVIEGMDDNEEG